jgi:C-terminal processing protease CtpA/Prc
MPADRAAPPLRLTAFVCICARLMQCYRELCRRMGYKQARAMIAEDLLRFLVIVYAGGPAAQAGLQPGDTIISVNGQAPPRPPFFPGESLTLQLKHHNQGAPFMVTLHAANTELRGSPDGRRLPDGLGYLDIPLFPEAFSSPASLSYATQGQQIIQSIDTTPPCGWVIDLRSNEGGDLYPMLAAVGPILGDGQAGTFIEADGTQIPWAYQDGQAIYGQQVLLQVPNAYHLQRPNPPVALLTSSLTASAGEATLISFLGRPNTRTFGEPTVGVPTSPNAITLSDGAILAVVGAQEEDRTGHLYPEQPLAPDQSVTPDWTQLGTENDPTLQAAEAWLQAQPGCAA